MKAVWCPSEDAFPDARNHRATPEIRGALRSQYPQRRRRSNARTTARTPGNINSRSRYRSTARGLAAAGTWLREQFASLLVKVHVRHTVRELSLLSDRELWDIGLLRAQIPQAASAAGRSRRHAARTRFRS
jgi:Domain of unknown function (DUF1127)